MSTVTTMEPERQILYQHVMDNLFNDILTDNVENSGEKIIHSDDLPDLILSSKETIDTLVQQYTELEKYLSSLDNNTVEETEIPNHDSIRGALYSKLILTLFGSIKYGTVSASQYEQWTKDRNWFNKIFSSDKDLFDDINEELIALEIDIITRIPLHDVLANDILKSKLKPPASLVELLFYDELNIERIEKNKQSLVA